MAVQQLANQAIKKTIGPIPIVSRYIDASLTFTVIALLLDNKHLTGI